MTSALAPDASTNPAQSPCVLCGVAAEDTWDGLALCETCEASMVEELREPGPIELAWCCDCGESFVPSTGTQRRCKWCNAVKLIG